MFVGAHVESGDECKAAAALLPDVIGNIQTAIGGGSLSRASGIAVQVMVGDPVCQGDVIETAADGRIGIRFIDGSVFSRLRTRTPHSWMTTASSTSIWRMAHSNL
jgi:hypothetical protein